MELSMVNRADDLVKEVNRARRSSTSSPPQSRPSSEDPAESLRKLAELRDAGVVTSEEFEAKKAELLGRL